MKTLNEAIAEHNNLRMRLQQIDAARQEVIANMLRLEGQISLLEEQKAEQEKAAEKEATEGKAGEEESTGEEKPAEEDTTHEDE